MVKKQRSAGSDRNKKTFQKTGSGVQNKHKAKQ